MINRKKSGAAICLCLLLAGTFVIPAQGAGASEEYQRINAANGNSESTGLKSELYSTYRVSTQPTPGNTTESSTDKTTGPGSVSGLADDTKQTGPGVEDTSMSETYHQDFGIYEENFENTYFLYSTVSNGGITDQSVSIDIPAGLDFTMEKDGVEIGYVSGQKVSERGTYVLRLTGVDDPSLPFSEQTIYKTVFRFRIQERLPVETEEERTGTGASSSSALYGGGMSMEDFIAAQEAWEAQKAQEAQEAQAAREAQEAQAGQDTWENGEYPDTQGAQTQEISSEDGADEIQSPAEISDNEEMQEENGIRSYISDDGTYNQESIDAALAAAIGTGATDPANLENYNPGNGLAQSYDPMSGYYLQELLTGTSFYTNVPNGMVTLRGVTIRNGSNDVTFTVYKDGEQIEYTAGTELSDPGSYTVFAEEATTLFISGYSKETKPVFRFRILTENVNDLGVLNAPEGMKIQNVLLEGETAVGAVSQDGSYARLVKDGAYTVVFAGEQGEVSESFLLDRVAPRFYVQTENNRAGIAWISGDVTRYELTKGGKPESSGGIIYEIKGSGSYVLTAYDAAGNTASAQITIPYALNTAAIVCVVLVILLVIAAVLFIRSVNRKVKVR